MRHPLISILLLVLVSPVVSALINPGLQPSDLFERYEVVLLLKITAIDEQAKNATVEVTRVIKGQFAPTSIVLALGDPAAAGAYEIFARPGVTLIAYVGGRRQADKICFYPAGGRWQFGSKDPTDPSRWTWTEDLDPATDGTGMSGTYNGATERLAEMMDDQAKGRYYFPAMPTFQFGKDVIVDNFTQPIGGVALYDLDGDGRLDIYACSAGGDRVYRQTGPLTFTDATAALGLTGKRSPSISIADVNADGRPDLLVGTRIHLANGDGAGRVFQAAELLPAAAGERLKSAAFVELNSDGYPDVLASTLQGGLHAWLNPGSTGGPFTDATAAKGLDQEDCGAGLTGHFAPGDWNGDGRTDLFYAVDRGLLLIQGADGRFSSLRHDERFDFSSDGKDDGLSGACCFAPLWTPDRFDIVATGQYRLQWIGMRAGQVRDLIPFGNEIWEGTDSMGPIIAEDLNADGLVDLYSGSRSVFRNAIHGNRGYGSFTTPVMHKPDIFPGPAYLHGALGLAAGDADGDGANDLLIGGADGNLVVVPNAALAGRGAKENPTIAERVLARTKIVSVQVSGKLGVLGATVSLADSTGTVVGLRVIGTNVATGCRGPDTVNLAVREPDAAHVLTVTYADGKKQTWPVDLSGPARRIVLQAQKSP